MREEIKSQIGKLVGLKLQYAGRASNLFWLGFGDIVQIVRRSRTEETAEYALHIQCSWRITLGNKIVVASRDFYTPYSQWVEKMRISTGIYKATIDLMNVLNILQKTIDK